MFRELRILNLSKHIEAGNREGLEMMLWIFETNAKIFMNVDRKLDPVG